MGEAYRSATYTHEHTTPIAKIPSEERVGDTHMHPIVISGISAILARVFMFSRATTQAGSKAKARSVTTLQTL